MAGNAAKRMKREAEDAAHLAQEQQTDNSRRAAAHLRKRSEEATFSRDQALELMASFATEEVARSKARAVRSKGQKFGDGEERHSLTPAEDAAVKEAGLMIEGWMEFYIHQTTELRFARFAMVCADILEAIHNGSDHPIFKQHRLSRRAFGNSHRPMSLRIAREGVVIFAEAMETALGIPLGRSATLANRIAQSLGAMKSVTERNIADWRKDFAGGEVEQRVAGLPATDTASLQALENWLIRKLVTTRRSALEWPGLVEQSKPAQLTPPPIVD